jgi:ribonuclease P protein component
MGFVVGPSNLIYETPISTVQDPPETPARLPESELIQERQSHFAQPPSRRSQTVDSGLIVMSAARPVRRGLGCRDRIKQGRDFLRVRQGGERAVKGCLIANWLKLPTESRSRLGVVVSKKVGNAVIRSRVKRLLRESYRQHQNELSQPLDLVLVARPSIAGKDFASVERDLIATLRQAGLLK